MSKPNGGSPLSYWGSLAAAADTGQLYLSLEFARECAAACDSHLAKLTDRQLDAKNLPRLSGYGDFTSGKHLAEILSDKMSGSGNSLVTVLHSHIDVVTEMQTLFAKFFTATQQIDDDSSADISQNGRN